MLTSNYKATSPTISENLPPVDKSKMTNEEPKQTEPQPNPQLSRLLQLKRLEHPPKDYHSNFLRDFQRRQRTELMQSSSTKLFVERFNTFLGINQFPVWRVAAAAACIVFAIGVSLTQAPANFNLGIVSPDPKSDSILRPINAPFNAPQYQFQIAPASSQSYQTLPQLHQARPLHDSQPPSTKNNYTEF